MKKSERTADRALSALTDSVAAGLRKAPNVALIGFGTFSTTKRAARYGRNHQAGESLKIKAKTVAKFKAGKKLADAVNEIATSSGKNITTKKYETL